MRKSIRAIEVCVDLVLVIIGFVAVLFLGYLILSAIKKPSKKDTYSYKGWLTSDSFWKRAFGCLLYQTAAVVVLYAAFMVVALLSVVVLGFFVGNL